MNKRKIIIISLTALAVILFGVAAFVFSNKSDKKDSFGTMTKGNYYVEKGVEKPADVAKKAMVAYLQQDISESESTRNDRLKEYFTSDSPVYDTRPELLSGVVNKSLANVTSVVTCEEQETTLCLNVSVEVKLYTGSNYEKVKSKYWVSINESGNSSKVYNVGLISNDN